MEDFKECVGRQIEILDACGNIQKTVTVAKMKATPQGIIIVDTDGDIYTEDELNLRYCLPPAYALFSFLKDQALLDEDTQYDATRYNNMFEDLMSMLERQGVVAKAND